MICALRFRILSPLNFSGMVGSLDRFSSYHCHVVLFSSTYRWVLVASAGRRRLSAAFLFLQWLPWQPLKSVHLSVLPKGNLVSRRVLSSILDSLL